MTTKKNLNENYKCKWLDTLRAIRIFCIWSTVSFLLTFKSRGINSIQKDVKIKDNTKILINKSKILKISMKIFIYPLYWIRIVKTQLNKKMLPHTCTYMLLSNVVSKQPYPFGTLLSWGTRLSLGSLLSCWSCWKRNLRKIKNKKIYKSLWAIN